MVLSLLNVYAFKMLSVAFPLCKVGSVLSFGLSLFKTYTPDSPWLNVLLEVLRAIVMMLVGFSIVVPGHGGGTKELKEKGASNEEKQKMNGAAESTVQNSSASEKAEN